MITLKVGDVVVLNTEKEFGYSFQHRMTILEIDANGIATCQADIFSDKLKYHIDTLSLAKSMPR